MDVKLQEIIQRLNVRLEEARKFQDKMAKRIRRMDEELGQLKTRSDRKKKP